MGEQLQTKKQQLLNAPKGGKCLKHVLRLGRWLSGQEHLLYKHKDLSLDPQ